MSFMFGFHFLAVPFLLPHSVVLVVFSPCVGTHLPPYTTYFLPSATLPWTMRCQYTLWRMKIVFYFLRSSACNIQIYVQL
jgi:hypothetical protein